MGERTVWLKLVATRESASGKALEFVPADDPNAAPRWCPRSLIPDMTVDYTVGQGEVLDVEILTWKARELGWAE